MAHIKCLVTEEGPRKKKSWGIFAMCAVSICGPMVPRLVWPWPGRGPAWRMTTDINAWMYETAGIWPKSTSAANTRHLFLMNLSIWWDVTCSRRPHCIFGWDFYCWHFNVTHSKWTYFSFKYIITVYTSPSGAFKLPQKVQKDRRRRCNHVTNQASLTL